MEAIIVDSIMNAVIVFISVGIPFLCVFGIIAYSRRLQYRQVQLILEERKLLIEKGATHLPPLELPKLSKSPSPPAPRPESRLRNLKWGIVLLFVSAALIAMHFTGGEKAFGTLPSSDALGLYVVLAAVGLALLVIHAISSHYEHPSTDHQQLLKPEDASVIEVDIEE